MTSVHSRQEQQVIDHAGQPTSLVQEGGEFLVDLGVEILARQQCFQTRAKNAHWTLQLVRGIRGIPSRSFQFLAGRSERGFGTLSLRPVLFRIHRQLLNWHGEAGRHNMASDKADEQEQCARAANLPAQPMLPGDRTGQRIKANFVRGGKERVRIESLIK